MKRSKWDAKTKNKIVLDGISGLSLWEICTEHGIQQNYYYRWRDQFLTEAYQVFEPKNDGSEVELLLRKTAKLGQIIGALTVGNQNTRTSYCEVAFRIGGDSQLASGRTYVLKQSKRIIRSGATVEQGHLCGIWMISQ